MTDIIENIIIERDKKVDSLVFGEIKEMAAENGIDTTIILNETAIVEALKKRIPERVINEPTYDYSDVPYTALCPECQQNLGYEAQHTYNFCFNCGQALDWR